MEKAYKIRHTPTGKYLSKSVSTYQNKWGLGPKGKAWSKRLPSLIEGGVLIDGKLIPESEFEFIELTAIDKKGLIEKIETLYDNKEYAYDTKTINDILSIIKEEEE